MSVELCVRRISLPPGWLKRLSVIAVIFQALTCSSLLMAAQPSSQHAGTEIRALAHPVSETSTMKIRLTVDGHEMTAELDDTPTARDFLSLLPLTLSLEDYAGTEKIAYLPGKLSEEDAPAGVDPSVGDITYYAPWGNLAVFYRDFGYARGLIKLGSIEKGVEVFNVPGSVAVTIELYDKESQSN